MMVPVLLPMEFISSLICILLRLEVMTRILPLLRYITLSHLLLVLSLLCLISVLLSSSL